MSSTQIFLLILGMTLVTYLPRMLPSFVIDKLHLSAKAEKFLKLIPYTAMAALIFPGVITIDENPVVGIAGGLTAAVLGWRKCPVMVCVLGAIAADFIVYMIIL